VLARGPWTPDAVTVRWREDVYAVAPETDALADAALEELGGRGSPTHDGLAARMAGLEVREAGFDIECQPVRWSVRLGDDAADSLSSLCVVRDDEGRWLAGRRAAWVASWPGRWALGAGGSVEVGENPVETLPRELEEEWGLEPDPLSVEALVRSPTGMVLLVGLARVPTGTPVQMDPEHDSYEWWPSDPQQWPDHADMPLRLMAALLTSG
jgi:ADP-ribose pyrophosphatase YjhB (NUDIX family)